MFKIKIGDREFLWASAVTCNIFLAQGTTEANLNCDDVKDKIIIGLAIRRQSAEAGITRMSTDNRPILSRAAMAQGHLYIEDGNKIVKKTPLEFFAYDPDVHEPGRYAQVIFPQGFKPSDSKASFLPDIIDADMDLEITFLTAPDNICSIIPIE